MNEPTGNNNDQSMTEDLDLEGAIGDVFNQLNFDTTTNDQQQQQQDNKDNLLSEPSKTEDLNLEDTIGDAFNDVFGSQEKVEEKNEADDHDLEDAIGDAFGDVFGNVTSQEQEKPEEPVEKGEEESKEIVQSEEKQDEGDDDLNDLIGEAFGSLTNTSEEKVTESQPDVTKEDEPIKPESTSPKNETEITPADETTETIPKDKEETEPTKETTSDDTETTKPIEEDQPSEELNLDDAIGDAFKNLLEKPDDNQDTPESQEKPKEEDETSKNVDTTDDKSSEKLLDIEETKPDDEKPDEATTDLDSAIGDAFKDLMANQPTNEPAKETPDNDKPTTKDTDTVESMDLDEAIGDAFKSIIGTEEPSTNVNEKPKEEEEDEDLDAAIGDVFKDLMATEKSKPVTQDKDTDDMDLDAAIGDAFKSVLPQSKNKSLSLAKTDVDNALENAIGEAFKSLASTSNKFESREQMNDEDLNAMIMQSFQQVMQTPNKSSQPGSDDMESAITQAFKSAMSSKPTPQLSSRELAIRNLAVEISHQVQDHLKDDKFIPPLPFIPGLPQLDDSVLAHFQKEAYTDDKSKASSRDQNIQSAISNAVKSMDPGGVADLEQLQMNDILQNAFRMALENPQELISDMEIEASIQVPQIIRPPPPQRPKFASPKPGYRNYTKSTPVVGPSKPTVAKKPVDKVVETETLKKPSLLSNPAVASQLTTIISTLTSRINSGELSDANILQVIRQMTEELASGGSLTPFLKKSTIVEDVAATYRDSKRQKMLKALQMSKIFIEKKLPGVEKDENEKIVTLVSTIIQAFDPIGFAKSVIDDIKDDESDSILIYLNEILTCILKKSPTTKLGLGLQKEIEKVQEQLPKTEITKTAVADINKISEDEELVKPSTDVFNLLAGSALLDISKPMVLATAVALSATGWVYKESTGSNSDTVINAVCRILEKLVSKTPDDESSLTKKRISDLILAGDLRRTKIDTEQFKIAVDAAEDNENNSWNSNVTTIKVPQYRRPVAQ
ncbi:hypothetical protein G210_0692 [Candida maltosa Xu316]|uniref:Uncharacterized protein n=1 Tax=Candida maltosa (strain Xu316) TaxID=1245528 RepID=M3IQF5_CANMX|nr:hypothetical protein G210_0692 [Candida maltosa Xu316]